jgi:hypothetical protein
MPNLVPNVRDVARGSWFYCLSIVLPSDNGKYRGDR